jgi:hypothetical protein
MSMTDVEVKAMVHDVIVHNGLPFMVLSVVGSPAAWQILVRGGRVGLVRFAVPGGRPVGMRVAIQERLESAV